MHTLVYSKPVVKGKEIQSFIVTYEIKLKGDCRKED